MKLLGSFIAILAHTLSFFVGAEIQPLPYEVASSPSRYNPRNALLNQEAKRSVALLATVIVEQSESRLKATSAGSKLEYTDGEESLLEIACAEDSEAQLVPAGTMQERNIQELELILNDTELERAASGEVDKLKREKIEPHLPPHSIYTCLYDVMLSALAWIVSNC